MTHPGGIGSPFGPVTFGRSSDSVGLIDAAFPSDCRCTLAIPLARAGVCSSSSDSISSGGSPQRPIVRFRCSPSRHATKPVPTQAAPDDPRPATRSAEATLGLGFLRAVLVSAHRDRACNSYTRREICVPAVCIAHSFFVGYGSAARPIVVCSDVAVEGGSDAVGFPLARARAQARSAPDRVQRP